MSINSIHFATLQGPKQDHFCLSCVARVDELSCVYQIDSSVLHFEIQSLHLQRPSLPRGLGIAGEASSVDDKPLLENESTNDRGKTRLFYAALALRISALVPHHVLDGCRPRGSGIILNTLAGAPRRATNTIHY